LAGIRPGQDRALARHACSRSARLTRAVRSWCFFPAGARERLRFHHAKSVAQFVLRSLSSRKSARAEVKSSPSKNLGTRPAAARAVTRSGHPPDGDPTRGEQKRNHPVRKHGHRFHHQTTPSTANTPHHTRHDGTPLATATPAPVASSRYSFAPRIFRSCSLKRVFQSPA
jgi:hypothetical protein